MSVIEFPERLDALPELEGALLWSMRAWALGLSRGIAVADEIQAMYADLGAPEAAHCLNGFMTALNNGALRMLDVNCVCHPAVSGDEFDLLDVLALQQEERGDDAIALLARMVAHEEAAEATAWITRLIARLNAAGHIMPRASEALRRHAFRAQFAWTATTSSACFH
ncbi:hypothetical protein [Roseomonas sp. 18066]|uniref:hypothetical protein n=1 Tax=Roseomonas sp. 18066 TaxID=2681412 RepID=UPI0013569059|nr:hypothetical protein [Roseomonas sp. 18066]